MKSYDHGEESLISEAVREFDPNFI
jgi:hypothetical protein